MVGNRGAWGVVAAAIILTELLWRRGLVSTKVAIAAAVLSVIFPYWIFPGFGMLVVVVAVVAARARRLREVHVG